MRNPLPAAHELGVDALAKGVAHAAVIAGEAYTAAYGGREVLDLLLLDLRHRDDRHDQAHVDDARIGKSFGRVLNIDFEALAFENLGEDMGALFPLQPPQTINASRIYFLHAAHHASTGWVRRKPLQN